MKRLFCLLQIIQWLGLLSTAWVQAAPPSLYPAAKAVTVTTATKIEWEQIWNTVLANAKKEGAVRLYSSLHVGKKNGDEVWVESEVGKVRKKVKLTESIRPDTLLIAGQFGQWATPGAKETGRVSQTMLTPIRHSWTDHVASSMHGQVVKAKVYKVQEE